KSGGGGAHLDRTAAGQDGRYQPASGGRVLWRVLWRVLRRVLWRVLRNEEGQRYRRLAGRHRPEPRRLPGGRIKREPRYTIRIKIRCIDEAAGRVKGGVDRMQPRRRASQAE